MALSFLKSADRDRYGCEGKPLIRSALQAPREAARTFAGAVARDHREAKYQSPPPRATARQVPAHMTSTMAVRPAAFVGARRAQPPSVPPTVFNPSVGSSSRH